MILEVRTVVYFARGEDSKLWRKAVTMFTKTARII
jgi:hypothetical protein